MPTPTETLEPQQPCQCPSAGSWRLCLHHVRLGHLSRKRRRWIAKHAAWVGATLMTVDALSYVVIAIWPPSELIAKPCGLTGAALAGWAACIH